MDPDFDLTKEVRTRLTTAGVDFSRLTWRDTESLIEDAAQPLRQEIERLRSLLKIYLQLLEASEKVLPYLPDTNDAKNYAATNDGRASNFQVAAIQLRIVAQEAKNAR